MVSRYLSLFCCFLALLPGEVLCTPSEGVKRASSSNQVKKLLVLEIERTMKTFVKSIIAESADPDKAIVPRDRPNKVNVFDRCTNITSVGKPVTHNTRQHTSGAWMKEPLGIMGTEAIFVMEYYSGKNVVEEFENMNLFKAGVTRKTYTLPYNWDGTGGVVYGPYLYYNRENSSYIIKYNLQTERVEAQMTVSGYTPRKNSYGWGGYSGMVLAVDEQGLWVLFGNTGNSGRLSASKIDVYKNDIIQTWNLNTEPMNQMGSAFVACGVIYCIDSYNNRSTTINFAFDTRTGKQWNPSIEFTNEYGLITRVHYNPREKELYVWNSHRQVTYPLTSEDQQSLQELIGVDTPVEAHFKISFNHT